MDFSGLFHQSSKDTGGHGTVHIPADNSAWPEEWAVIHYKEYPNMPRIVLPENCRLGYFTELIENRKSSRDFNGAAISAMELSSILKYSCGETEIDFDAGQPKRAQPSGGGRFPLEVYPIVFRTSETLAAGVYHYNVRQHALDVLREREFDSADINTLTSYGWAADAAVALVTTGIFDRTQMKYGERGYRYILLEAGHFGQNVYFASQSLDLGCCALGGTCDHALEELIGVDGVNESLVYVLIVGGIR